MVDEHSLERNGQIRDDRRKTLKFAEVAQHDAREKFTAVAITPRSRRENEQKQTVLATTF